MNEPQKEGKREYRRREKEIKKIIPKQKENGRK
jgi:hypothetical protein